MITIVVLLILAGVSLNLVLGSNGIIAKAKDAKNQTEQDKIKTETALNSLYDEMVAATGGSSSSDGNGDIPEGRKTYTIDGVGKFATTGTWNGGVASASNPTIPAEYTPVNTKDAKWDVEGGPEYNNGLVIVDDSGNEWVWVPVADASVMYETSETPIALSGETEVTTTKYSASRIFSIGSGSGSGSGAKTVRTTRGLPRNFDCREPDVTNDDNDSKAQTAGYTDLADMATNLVSDYETMITSIEKYKGFYIGRYELTADGEKAGATLTDVNWYQSYANCKNLSASDKAITRMIWGCQWDVTCNWLIESRAKTSNEVLTNSESWGNYRSETKRDTGYSENWKANNIYDLAGNCEEWTQEAFGNGVRATRGSYHLYGLVSAFDRDTNSSFTDTAYDHRRLSRCFNSAT